jgi:phenylacetate-CoA ligase
MCVRPLHPNCVETVSTGGTSGVPLQFHIDANRSSVEYAYLVSGWARAGFELDEPLAVLRGEVVPQDFRGLRHQYDPLLRRHYYSTFHMTDENMRRYVAHIATIGPCYLLVYPSSVSALARFMERTGIRPPGNIRGVLAGSEIVYAEDRARVERVLGVRCFSWYGHSEKLVMAAECEHCDDYHVFPTYGYFELLDDAGRPVSQPGQRGEIVGTGFINTVMPFIRYRTGDFATYVADRCDACGRQHVLIRDIRGHRTQEMLVARDGSLISWTALNMHDNTFDYVRQFQFAQTVPGHATLKIVPADGFDHPNLERIQRNLGRKLDGRVEFDIQRVDSIPLTPSGKSTFVDQKLDLNAVVAGVGAVQA